MSKIRELPRKDEHFDLASQWIARLDRRLSVEEAEALRTWMAADPENAAVLLSMAETWDKMDALSRLADLFPASSPRRRSHTWRGWAGWAVAASVAVLAGSWVMLGTSVLLPERPGIEFADTTDNVYETAIGQQSTVTLPDGTVVVLNTNSVMRVEYTTDHRTVTLERGEINVRVAEDKSRPLSVLAGDQIIQAVGTEFNVAITEGQKIELVVTEGTVRVGVQKKPQGRNSETRPKPGLLAEPSHMVTAGQELILGDPGELITPVSPEEIKVKLSWREGNLIFRGDPLEEVVKEVGRYTAVEFVFLDEGLRRVRVSGLFKAGDVDSLLATLRANFDIVYERLDEKTVLLDSP